MTNPKDAIGLTKPALRLVPPALSLHVSQAMADGAKKYGAYNWRQHPVNLTVYVEAAMRHLLALLDGEDCARDSGHHHAAHVGACMAIILDAKETGNLIDDRASGGCASDIIENLTEKPKDLFDTTMALAVECAREHLEKLLSKIPAICLPESVEVHVAKPVEWIDVKVSFDQPVDEPIPFKLTPRPLKAGDRVKHEKTSRIETVFSDSDEWRRYGWTHFDGTPIAAPRELAVDYCAVCDHDFCQCSQFVVECGAPDTEREPYCGAV